MAPPPGRMPSAEPSAVPRRIGPAIRRQSSRLGIRFVTLLTKTERSLSFSRLRMISPTPNMPIATVTKPIPSASSGMPKVKRCTAELASVPTTPSSRPIRIMPNARSSDPWASTTEALNPSTIREKYSGGPNFSATCASGGAASASRRVETVPAKNEPIAAVASATPARPFRAIA